jgi:hypothetical protein
MTYLDKLREVYLYKNGFYSDLPPDVGMMEDLEDIRLGENQMYGTIPDSFYNLVKMKKIFFEDTLECSNVTGDCEASSVEGFEGSLQTEIGNMKDLSMLVINNNPLTGTLPAELGNCEQLCKSRSQCHVWLLLQFHVTYILTTTSLATNSQHSSIFIKPILKAQSLNQFACSVTKCSTPNQTLESFMQIAVPTTRLGTHLFLARAARIAAITLRRFVLLTIKYVGMWVDILL